jgi:hypothetical protein
VIYVLFDGIKKQIKKGVSGHFAECNTQERGTESRLEGGE